MAQKLYTVTEDGGILFKMGHNAWGVSIPAYAYDIWMPLIGAKALGVYGTYVRLGYSGEVWGQGLRELARAMRISDNTLRDINTTLVECGFIDIEVPKGEQRVMHYTTKITLLEPPRTVPVALLEKYVVDGDPTRYATLVPWHVEDEGRNRYPAITEIPNRQVAIRPQETQSLDSDAKKDPLEKDPSKNTSRAFAREAGPAGGYVPDYAGMSIQGAQEDRLARQGEKRVSGDDDPVDEERVVEEEPEYTAFEEWMIAACYNTRKLSATQRKLFNVQVRHVDKDFNDVLSPTINEAWDTDPAYREFVKREIVPELADRRQLHPTGFDRALNSRQFPDQMLLGRGRYDNSSSIDQMWSVRPATIAGER
jgi:hypothetical protein